MNEAAVESVARVPRRATISLPRARVTRRGLQIALGLLWILDGALQLQPFMLGTGFAREVIAAAAAGQPHVVAGPVNWVADVIAAHPVLWDIPFAGVQLLLGLGMLVPRTARFALAASLPWAIGVWYFGEALGGLASGQASLLTGAPGAVLFYGALALAAWPRNNRADVPPSGWFPFAWAALWLGGGLLQALPANNSGSAVASVITDGSDSAPQWLARLDTSFAGWIADHGPAVVVVLVAAEALIGLAALHRRTRMFAAGAGLLFAIAIWVVGEDLGRLYTGQSTDPNSAPLIALMAVALPFASTPTERRSNGIRTAFASIRI
jgi:hypothetical protein